MVQTNSKVYEDDFFRWLAPFLKDKGLQFSKCGFKLRDGLGSRHEIDLSTGNWREPEYSNNKPPRWLFQLTPGATGLTATTPAHGSQNLGAINSAQEDKAGVVFRIVPLVQIGPDQFARDDRLEVHALFIFHGPTPKGSSAEPINFDPGTGTLKFKDKPLSYIGCGLLGIHPRYTKVEFSHDSRPTSVTYGDAIDAIAASITVTPKGSPPGSISVFDLTQKDELDRLKKMVEDAWYAAGPVSPSKSVVSSIGGDDEEGKDEPIAPASLEIPESPDLIGIDPAVYRQINAALKSGKQHIMLYGPPGTGKTTLARWIGTVLTGGQWTLVTGSSDWSSQDIIGGYQPVGDGGVAFIPGVLLRHFDRPLIIDELNRCDIDKVIGPLFTVLSGQQTTLPYRLDIESVDSEHYVILPESKPSAERHEFAPGGHWRIIATINSIDKAALYQMSYALSRRFGWVYLDVPQNTTGFIVKYLLSQRILSTAPDGESPCPLGAFWNAINEVRPIGPAPIIDAIKAIQTREASPDFFATPTPTMQQALLDAIDMVLLPMLDGIVIQDAELLASAATRYFGLESENQRRIERRMNSIAV